MEREQQPLLYFQVIFVIEPRAVPPLPLLDPGTVQFIPIVIGVRDASGIDQRLMYASRSRNIDPVVGPKLLGKGAQRDTLAGGIVLQTPTINKHGPPRALSFQALNPLAG